MSTTLSTKLNISGSSVFGDGAGLVDNLGFGNAIPSLTRKLSQTSGTTYQQVAVPISLAAAGSETIDMSNPSNALTDKAGRPINLTKLYLAILCINVPDGNQLLEWGPLSVSNAAQLWFNATTGGETTDSLKIHFSQAGWTLANGTAHLIKVTNPGSVTASGTILFVGKQ